MFLNSLAIDQREILSAPLSRVRQCLLVLALIYFFWPSVITAFASLLLKDKDYLFGVAISTLAPSALVIPFFARHRGGDLGLSLLAVVLSTLLCPLLTLPMLRALGFTDIFIEARYLFVYLISLTTLPVLLSLAVNRFWSRSKRLAEQILPWANSFLLALLMFILVGSSLHRVPIRLWLHFDFLYLMLIFVAFDFGLYWLTRKTSLLFFSSPVAESIALAIATRNLAVSASLMLSFHPKAALPCALGLIIHAAFFQWLLWPRTEPYSALPAKAARAE